MPPTEVSYRPSRVKQTIAVVILALVFMVSTAGLALLWPLEPRNIDNIAMRTLAHNLGGLGLVVLAAFAVLAAVGVPILLVMMLLHRPAFTLTPDGIRVGGGLVVAWEEIDEI